MLQVKSISLKMALDSLDGSCFALTWKAMTLSRITIILTTITLTERSLKWESSLAVKNEKPYVQCPPKTGLELACVYAPTQYSSILSTVNML